MTAPWPDAPAALAELARLQRLERLVQQWARAHRGAWPSEDYRTPTRTPTVDRPTLHAAERALLEAVR